MKLQKMYSNFSLYCGIFRRTVILTNIFASGLFLLVWGSLLVGVFMIGIEWVISCYSLMNSRQKDAPKSFLEAT